MNTDVFPAAACLLLFGGDKQQLEICLHFQANWRLALGNRLLSTGTLSYKCWRLLLQRTIHIVCMQQLYIFTGIIAQYSL